MRGNSDGSVRKVLDWTGRREEPRFSPRSHIAISERQSPLQHPSDTLRTPFGHPPGTLEVFNVTMTEDDRPPSVRLRAPRACQACSARKVRCDATEVGLPCSRCRVNESPNCFLVASRRGTYARKPHQKQAPRQVTAAGAAEPPRRPTQAQRVASQPASQADPPLSSMDSSTQALSQDNSGVDSMALDASSDFASGSECQNHQEAPQAPQQQDSLKYMFEKFLEQQGHKIDDATNTCGFIFMSGASPLTFALEEARDINNKAGLHDADPQLSNGDGTGAIEPVNHPVHLASHDIAYLKAKGTFERQTSDVLNALLAAFTERFYPSYSIVDLNQLKESFKAETLPWILLHAVCFIGATFCDLSVIHRAGFKGRWHARRQFYDKAKLLFDLGYETNKIVLLQSVIMLSFWGPQMKSYWNPCSWVGFGVTIAESLGIHRMGASTQMDSSRKSLLKRLFWVLAVRDAYCAALLGRPCRLNMTQCNTAALCLDDFDHVAPCGNPDDHDKRQSHAHYQIQVSKLSLILRNIIGTQFGLGRNASTISHLHGQLERWQSELPSSVSWGQQQSQTTDVFALSLKIIFHFQIILVHLERPEEALRSSVFSPCVSSSSSEMTESAAHTISSTAFTIVSSSMLSKLPHETFPGFLVASIVFYRGIRNPHGGLPQLPRSALDNCQMVISEARERWDPAIWVLKIFDFLLSSTTILHRNDYTIGNSMPMDPGTTQFPSSSRVPEIMPEDDILHSIAFGSPSYQDMISLANESFPMSNYLPMSPESTAFRPM